MGISLASDRGGDKTGVELARFLQPPSRAPIAAGVGGRGLELEQGPVMRAMGKPGAGGRGTAGPVFLLVLAAAGCRIRQGRNAPESTGSGWSRGNVASEHWSFRLRGEPRQCGDRAHRLIPPSMAPTGERRPSMACLRPIPAPPRLSPTGCPWLRRCRPGEVEGNARRSGEHHGREGRRCKGISSERYMDVPRPRVGAGRGTTRRTKSPCSGGPRRSRGFTPTLQRRPPREANGLRHFSTWPDPASPGLEKNFFEG